MGKAQREKAIRPCVLCYMRYVKQEGAISRSQGKDMGSAQSG